MPLLQLTAFNHSQLNIRGKHSRKLQCFCPFQSFGLSSRRVAIYIYNRKIRRLGFESPSNRDICCLKKFDTFTRTFVRVSKLNAVARAQLTFQIFTLLKNIYTARARIKNMGPQMSDPDSSDGYSIGHESEGWGFESPSGRDIFCLKNFDTFTRTSVCVENECCCPRTFQMLTLLHIYIYMCVCVCVCVCLTDDVCSNFVWGYRISNALIYKWLEINSLAWNEKLQPHSCKWRPTVKFKKC